MFLHKNKNYIKNIVAVVACSSLLVACNTATKQATKATTSPSYPEAYIGIEKIQGSLRATMSKDVTLSKTQDFKAGVFSGKVYSSKPPVVEADGDTYHLTFYPFEDDSSVSCSLYKASLLFGVLYSDIVDSAKENNVSFATGIQPYINVNKVNEYLVSQVSSYYLLNGNSLGDFKHGFINTVERSIYCMLDKPGHRVNFNQILNHMASNLRVENSEFSGIDRTVYQAKINGQLIGFSVVSKAKLGEQWFEQSDTTFFSMQQNGAVETNDQREMYTMDDKSVRWASYDSYQGNNEDYNLELLNDKKAYQINGVFQGKKFAKAIAKTGEISTETLSLDDYKAVLNGSNESFLSYSYIPELDPTQLVTANTKAIKSGGNNFETIIFNGAMKLRGYGDPKSGHVEKITMPIGANELALIAVNQQ